MKNRYIIAVIVMMLMVPLSVIAQDSTTKPGGKWGKTNINLNIGRNWSAQLNKIEQVSVRD